MFSSSHRKAAGFAHFGFVCSSPESETLEESDSPGGRRGCYRLDDWMAAS